MSDLARPNVMKVEPYVPGKPIEEVERELGLTNVVKLASNENPLGPSPKAMEAVKNAIERMHIYPDGAAFEFKKALAQHFDLPTNYFFPANGSDEIIQFMGLAYLCPDDEVVIAEPSFARYYAVAGLNDVKEHRVPLTPDLRHDLKAMRAKINEKTKLVYIANPNNPTGTIVTDEEFKVFMSHLPPRTIVVFDEAYREFAEDKNYPQSLPYIETHNIIVLRTMSKAYGLAGIRVGYGIARPELLEPMEHVREPFNVNSIAQIAAVAALGDKDHLKCTVELNSRGKRYLYDALRRMGVKYAPTEANFVLIDTEMDGKVVYDALLRKGVIVRPCTSFGLPSYLRVSIGTPAENELFIAAFKDVLATLPETQ